MNLSKTWLLTISASAIWVAGADAQSSYTLRSPDKRIEIRVRTADRLQYDVVVNGEVLLQNSTASINIDKIQFGQGLKVKGVKERTVDGVPWPRAQRVG